MKIVLSTFDSLGDLHPMPGDSRYKTKAAEAAQIVQSENGTKSPATRLRKFYENDEFNRNLS